LLGGALPIVQGVFHESQALGYHLAHQLVEQPQALAHGFRRGEDALGDLLGTHPLKGHLHDNGLVGKYAPHGRSLIGEHLVLGKKTFPPRGRPQKQPQESGSET